MSKSHDLKTEPEPFQQVWDRDKLFELRKNDRDFKVGDKLWLHEYIPPKKKGGVGTYTHRSVLAFVTSILEGKYGVPDGYCIMSIAASVNRIGKGKE